jgi:hypothetical protein
VHESAGHLGIFVAGSVAKKEHAEFASNIDLIEVLPPGLYEAVITPKQDGDNAEDLIGGDYLVRFEARTLDDIRALGGNGEEDERRFATVARLSEINLGLYRTFMQPWIRLFANEGGATLMRKLHPLRLQFELFSSANPFMGYLASMAEVVRQNRQSVSKDNVFAQAEASASKWIESSLNNYRDLRDELIEAAFLNTYGSPILQAMVGLKASDGAPRRRPGLDATYKAFVAQRAEELKRNIEEGGPREAAIRAALYIRLPEGVADERGFRLLQRLREEAGSGLTLAAFEKVVRDQFFSLLLDERRAVEAIPAMLSRDPELASRMTGALGRLIEVVGVESPDGKARLREMEKLFKQRPVPANDAARSATPQEAPPRRAPLRKVGGEPD